MPYRVLSFDGGGIRGLFSATVLARLVEKVPALVEDTDLLAGTSTGGIIALALARGMTPQEIADLYRTRGPDIFDDSWYDDLRDAGKMLGADYGNERLRAILIDVLGGATTLGHFQKKVLISAFDLCARPNPEAGRPRIWKAKFFHNYPGKGTDAAERAVDVALRTSAAPTYFPAYQRFIDGGVIANNPSVAALAQALEPETGGQTLDAIRLLSIGTGAVVEVIEEAEKHEELDWGAVHWARPLVDIMIGGSAGVADYQCRQILGADRYRRIDCWLEGGPVGLDDVSRKALDYLIAKAHEVDIDPVVDWLRERWSPVAP